MYRGLYVDKPQSVLLREEQELPLRPHQLRIRTRFAAIEHGTEFHIFSGESPFQDLAIYHNPANTIKLGIVFPSQESF